MKPVGTSTLNVAAALTGSRPGARCSRRLGQGCRKQPPWPESAAAGLDRVLLADLGDDRSTADAGIGEQLFRRGRSNTA